MSSYNKIYYASKYLKYLFIAKNKHGVHSPFLYDFITKVVNNKGEYYSFKEIERLLLTLQLNSDKINITNFGTGKSKPESISNIAYNSTQIKRYSRLMFRMVDYFKPSNIIELGTSLGISTSYLAKANSKTTVHTIEGCPDTANVASSNFRKLNLKNINLIVGDFTEELPKLLKTERTIGLLYIDGNHALKPTLEYFNLALNYVNQDSIIIFDDIHWSKEMELAWESIIEHKKITLSIDLFKIGIVFFNNKLSKQHFYIKF